MWMHINFWFNAFNKKHRTSYYLTSIQQKKFHNLLRILINNPFVKRKFFLYEPSPHCFLALEINDCLANIYGKIIIKICKQKKLKFIKQVNYTLNSNDEKNGKLFLNCLDKFIDVVLTSSTPYPPWLKKFPFRNLRLTAHIIHCCLNQITNSRPLERKFYKAMYKTYKYKKK